MAYDEALADRLREALAGVPHDEKRMFGGLAFLVGGHMAIAASGQGGLLARVDPAESETLAERPGVSRMVMGGREMDGWLRVEAGDDLGEWVERGLAFVRTLPPR